MHSFPLGQYPQPCSDYSIVYIAWLDPSPSLCIGVNDGCISGGLHACWLITFTTYVRTKLTRVEREGSSHLIQHQHLCSSDHKLAQMLHNTISFSQYPFMYHNIIVSLSLDMQPVECGGVEPLDTLEISQSRNIHLQPDIEYFFRFPAQDKYTLPIFNTVSLHFHHWRNSIYTTFG